MRPDCAQDSDPEENRVEELVTSCLAGGSVAQEALYNKISGDLRKIARGIAPDLVDRQLDEDVVQQVFVQLLSRPPGHFDPGRGSVWAYLKVMVRLAARDVRTAYSPPRQPQRPGRACGRGSPPPLSFDDIIDADADGRFAEEIEDMIAANISAHVLIESVPAAAPAWLRRALAYIAEGLTITEVSAAIGDGVSRFAVRRALDRWVRPDAKQLRSTG